MNFTGVQFLGTLFMIFIFIIFMTTYYPLKKVKKARFRLPHWLGPAHRKPPNPPVRWGYCNGGCD